MRTSETHGTPLTAPAVGEVLAGKYRIDRVIGEGGMGVVVAATHLELDQVVALKFLRPEALGNAEALERFLREARAASKLRGEHVARVSDVGRLESGIPYIVMEYLEGEDLDALVVRTGALPWASAVEYLLQACEAIAEAHVNGIVHRDIKTANLFLSRDAGGSPQIKVLDFGISKSTDNDLSLTQTQSVMGSPLYMAPEQMRSARGVDVRTDIWSLGVVLYELIDGRLPFVTQSFPELCLMVAMDATPPLAVPLPAGLDAVVYRCLEKDPARRYPNVGELAAALAPFVTDGDRSLRRIRRLLGQEIRRGSAADYTPTPPPQGMSWMPPRVPVPLEQTDRTPPPAMIPAVTEVATWEGQTEIAAPPLMVSEPAVPEQRWDRPPAPTPTWQSTEPTLISNAPTLPPIRAALPTNPDVTHAVRRTGGGAWKLGLALAGLAIGGVIALLVVRHGDSEHHAPTVEADPTDTPAARPTAPPAGHPTATAPTPAPPVPPASATPTPPAPKPAPPAVAVIPQPVATAPTPVATAPTPVATAPTPVATAPTPVATAPTPAPPLAVKPLRPHHKRKKDDLLSKRK